MKKLIAAMILICIVLSLCACNPTRTGSSSSSSSSSSSGYNWSSIKEKIENKAFYEAYSRVKRDYKSGYDISATRYKVGKTDFTGGKFEIYYTFYLYDNYGSYKCSAQYCVYGKYDSSTGETSSVYVRTGW